MNVLVYNGNGTTLGSVKHALETLRGFLEPYYAVSTISTKALQNEPWMLKTSALVFPGGADLPFVKDCKNIIPQIKRFVNQGGIYIGFCAGSYFGSGRCEFAQGNPLLEVTGDRDLALFAGIARGPAYTGFQYNSEVGSKAVKLVLPDGTGLKTYYNGGPLFVDADKYDNVEILAKYVDLVDVSCSDLSPTTEAAAAVLLCNIGKGKALLTGPHPEFIPHLLEKSSDSRFLRKVVEVLKEEEGKRLKFMSWILSCSGLKCNEKNYKNRIPSLTPLLFAAAEDKRHLLNELENNFVTKGLDDHFDNSSYYEFDGGRDKFQFYKNFKNNYHDVENITRKMEPDDFIKTLIFQDENESFPSTTITPHFDMNKYFSNLNTISLGSLCMYGDVVTSTSVLLNENRNFLECIPKNSTVHIGSIQVAGRGRGSNTWVSPYGVSCATVVVNIPTLSSKTGNPVSIVFVQYLAMLAYCQAITTYSPGCENIPVRLKWPNDLYALNNDYYQKKNMTLLSKTVYEHLAPLSDIEPAYVKIGGILVNTNIINNEYSLLLGCGINVGGEVPTTTLNKWIDILNIERAESQMPPLPHIEIEILLAKYINKLEVLLNQYIDYGSDSILPGYYKFWLHENQIVTLTDHNNAKARITGITKDYGLLIAREFISGSETGYTGSIFHLQPDGNTFDIFKGLISRKVYQ